MRDGFRGRASGLLLVSTVMVLSCGDYDPATANGGTGGSSTGNGGSAGASGSDGSGGASTGGGSGGNAGGSGVRTGGAQASPATGCTMSEGGTMVTGFCADAPLNVLTPAEQVQLCSETGAYVAGVIDRPISCKFVSIRASGSASAPTEEEMRATCAAGEMACNQDATAMGAGAMTQCSAVPAGCTATIEQYSTCIMDAAVVFEQEADELVGCSMLTLANLATFYEVPTAATNAPGCAAIKAACPTYILPYIN